MGLFNSRKSKDEYEEIYEDDHEYEELDESEDVEEVIEKLRGTIKSGDCLLCHGKNTMHYEGNCFVCSKCNEAVSENMYYRWAAGYPVDLTDEYGRPWCDSSYEDFYDEEGDIALVRCDHCLNGFVRWKDGQYICPECGEIMPRAELFNAIGVEPLGPKCVTCDELFPGCISCPHGYVEEEDF